MNDLLPHLTPEETLLLSLCRLEFSKEQKAKIRGLMKGTTDWDRFVKLANDHGIIALAWHNIVNSGNSNNIPEKQLKVLHGACLINLTRTTYLYDKLEWILGLIKDENIKVVLLKGMALERTLYGNRGLRQMTDIDILVRVDDVLRLRKILLKKGFRSDPFKSALYRYLIPYLNTHIPRLTKDDCHVEIHYKLFDQADNSLTEKLYETSTPLCTGDVNAFVPPPLLFFLYLISHLNHHLRAGDSQLRQYTDIYLLLLSRYNDIINDQLISLASDVKMEKELAGMLHILKIFWGADYPGWLNAFIREYDTAGEEKRFCRFISQPKDNDDKEPSANYLKQAAVIPGLHRKILFVAGFFFPSVGFMKKRYRTRTKAGAVMYYPVRWVETVRKIVG